MTPAQVGQQVFNNYGPKSNEEFLVGYGFCIPDNPQVGCWLVRAGAARVARCAPDTVPTCRVNHGSQCEQDWVAIKVSLGADPNARSKLELLQAAGLGLKHFIRRSVLPPGACGVRRAALVRAQCVHEGWCDGDGAAPVFRPHGRRTSVCGHRS